MSISFFNTLLQYVSYPRITLNAPNGVTKIGGANEYAEKFNISPIATIIYIIISKLEKITSN